MKDKSKTNERTQDEVMEVKVKKIKEIARELIALQGKLQSKNSLSYIG